VTKIKKKPPVLNSVKMKTQRCWAFQGKKARKRERKSDADVKYRNLHS